MFKNSKIQNNYIIKKEKVVSILGESPFIMLSRLKCHVHVSGCINIINRKVMSFLC